MPSPDTDPYFTPDPSPTRRSLDPSERVRQIALRANIPPDIAEDYLKTTKIESGHNINVGASSKGALGFGQVMPDQKGGSVRTVGGRQYNLKDPDQNIEAGLRYFAEGGPDPTGRRLHYFGGPRARIHYEKTGQIPNISDGNMTAAQYVKATGAGTPNAPIRAASQSPQSQPQDDPYFTPDVETPQKPARKSGSWFDNKFKQGKAPPSGDASEQLARDIDWHFGSATLDAFHLLPADQQQAIARKATQLRVADEAKRKRGVPLVRSEDWQLQNRQQLGLDKAGPVRDELISQLTRSNLAAQQTPEAQAERFRQQGQEFANLPWWQRGAITGATGIAEAGGGLARLAGKVGVPGAADVGKGTELLSRDIRGRQAEAAKIKPPGWLEKAEEGLISYAPLALGGAPEGTLAKIATGAGTFGVYSGSQAYGRGQSAGESLKEGAKAAPLGALLGVPKSLVPFGGSLVKGATATLAKAPAIYGLARAEGATHEQALEQTALLTGFQVPELIGAGVGREAPKVETLTQVPDIQGKLADRAARIEPITSPSIAAKRIGLREGVNETQAQPNVAAQSESAQPSETVQANIQPVPDSGVVSQSPRHVDLQPRRVRGEGKGQFKPETRAEKASRQAKVSPSEQSDTTVPQTPQTPSIPTPTVPSKFASSPEVLAKARAGVEATGGQRGQLPATAREPLARQEPSRATGVPSSPESSGSSARSVQGKEPWQMKREDYVKQSGDAQQSPAELRTAQPKDYHTEVTLDREPVKSEEVHRDAVEDAFKRGEKIPPEVLRDYPWLAAREAIKPYVESLRVLSDKELKKEAKRTVDNLNAWANNTPGLVNGRVNPELGKQAGFEVSEKMHAVDREIEARKTKSREVPTPPTEAAKAADATTLKEATESPVASAKEVVKSAAPKTTETKPDPYFTPEPSTTAAKKASMSADRESLDLPELPPAERKSWRTSLSNAKPEKATVLADEVLTKPRALNDEETASLVVRAQEIKNEHAQTMKEIGAASDPDVIKAKKAQADALEREFDRITRATKASGTEKGRTLAAQKLTINQDYDLVSLVQRAKAAKGRDLTPDERVRYEKMASQIEDLNKQLAEANEKAQTAQLERQIGKIKRQTRRQETKAVLDTEFASLKASLAQAKLETRSGVQGSLLAGLDPEGKLTPIIAKMAKNRVKAGINSAEALVDEVFTAVKDHYDVSRDDIAKIVRGTLHQPDDVLSKWDKRRQAQLLKQQSGIETRLAGGGFSPKASREMPIYNRETARLQRRVDEIKRRYSKEMYRATRSTGGKISDELAKSAGVAKTIKSMGDISAVFRQGGWYSLTHPVRGFALPLKDMIRAFSDAGYRNVEQAIKSHPKFEDARRDGVEFTGVDKNDPNLSKHEEGYLGSEYLDYIPVAKQVKDFSERTFVSFLDSQRMNIYDTLTEGLTNPSVLSRLLGAKQGLSSRELAADRKRIAQTINSGTGRGSLGAKGNQAVPVLNIAMFSPRLLKSRVDLLNNMFNPVAWARMPRNVRAQILQDNVKFMAATVGVMALARSLGGEVNTDPDDGDFLKIRFGNTTYDTLTGLAQPMRYAINMGRAVKADITDDPTYAGKSKGELTGQFARSKLSPIAGTTLDYLVDKDFSGRKFSAKRAAIDAVTPLPAKDVVEAFKQDGLLGAIKSTPTFTGIGVQTYAQSPEKPQTRAEKLTRKLIRDKMPSEGRTDEEIDRDQKLGELRSQARRGVDVSKSLEALKGQGVIDERKEKSILSSRGVTRLQEGFKRLGLKEALTVYSTMTPSEQESVKKIMGEKAITVDLLPLDDQKDVRKKLEGYGFKPGLQIPKRPAVNRPERPNPRAWSQQ
jgi:hypothetical protein